MNAIDYFPTPIGMLEIRASSKGITKIVFTEEVKPTHPSQLTDQCKKQLQAYFSGERRPFDLPLEVVGTTFQQSVWHRLSKIPFGETTSYQKIALSIHNSNATRAVGSANGRNPIAIVVPCHRVIGASGKLTGYAWGLDKKQWLLKHEGILIAG